MEARIARLDALEKAYTHRDPLDTRNYHLARMHCQRPDYDACLGELE